MKREIQQPTHEQACAVLRFAKSNGLAWKRALAEHWMNECSAHRLTDADRALLRQARNQCGPLWLEQISLPELTATCVLPNMKVCAILAKTHYGLTPDELGIDDRKLLDGVLHGGESLLELVNYPAEKYNLSRIDKTEGWGIPSKDPLDEDDLAAAIAQLNELAQVQP
jgi:hypothetical protein